MATGREERFIALYYSAVGRILAYAVRRTRTAEDAADLVAETFAIAWRRLDDVPHGDAELLWLYATARKVLANQIRSDVRRVELVARMGKLVADELTRSQGPVEIEAVDAVRIFEGLSGDDREILMLAGWEGLSTEQLSYVLGCAPVAARVRLHQARKRLDVALSGIPDKRRIARSLRSGASASEMPIEEVRPC